LTSVYSKIAGGLSFLKNQRGQQEAIK